MAIKDNLQPFWGFNVQGITKDDGSANDAFISSLQSELDKTELDLYSSKLETYLETVEGRWLDYWGRWLGLHRDNRSDDDYRTDLINHVLHERNTISAIKEALTDFLKINQDHIYIYEPWRDMFVWNASHYNTHKFFTDPYYRYAVIDIQIEGPYSEVVNEIINLFRPAGVYWVVTSLVNVINNTAPILDLSLPTTQIIESADTDYANFTQTNSAYLNSKLDLATYVGDPFNYNKDNLNAGKQYMTSNSSYNPVVFVGSNEEEYDSIINTNSGGVNLASGTSSSDQTSGNASQTTGWQTPTIATFANPQAGQQYTISVNTKSNGGSWRIQVWDGTSPTQRVKEIYGAPPVVAQEQKHIATITWPSGANQYLLVQLVNNNDGGQITWNSAMLENGTVAHDWSPNPSDSGYNSWLQAVYDSWLQTKYQDELALANVGINLLQGTSTKVNQGPLDFKGIPVTAGNSYTFSGIMSSPSTSGIISPYIQFYDGSGNKLKEIYHNSNVPVAIGTSFVLTGVAPTNAVTARVVLAQSISSITMNYCLLKFEQGSQPTPWSPNPSDSGYTSWLQTKYQNELAITSQQLKQQLGNQITNQPILLSSIDSQAESFTVDQTQTSLLGGIDLLNYLTVYNQAVKPSNQTAKQFILANLANSNTQRLELVLQNQANIDLTQAVRLELYDYNLHLWIKPIIEYEVHTDYTIFKINLSSLAPYLSDGGNFMFQVWPTTPNITTLSVNYLGFLFNAPSDIITLANSDETFTMETN